MDERLVKEVIAKLMDNLVENICMPDIRCDGVLIGEVSGSPTIEAGVGGIRVLGSS
jgi:hypothetical protein